MASRKKFLPEDEIQGLERMGSQQLTDHLSGLSHEALMKLFIRMLNSYRLAARVANAAARFMLAMVSPEVDQTEALAQLHRELAEYMPNQFTMHAGDLEVLCDELTTLHGDLEAAGCPQEALEILETRLISYEQQLQRLRVQVGDQLSLPARTPVTR